MYSLCFRLLNEQTDNITGLTDSRQWKQSSEIKLMFRLKRSVLSTFREDSISIRHRSSLLLEHLSEQKMGCKHTHYQHICCRSSKNRFFHEGCRHKKTKIARDKSILSSSGLPLEGLAEFSKVMDDSFPCSLALPQVRFKGFNSISSILQRYQLLGITLLFQITRASECYNREVGTIF